MEENHRSEDKKRRRWSREETTGFLRCYLARKAEFEHPKKKRVAYANVLEDMVSLGISDSDRTPVCLESKIRTLLQAYKAARDNNRSTGASPCFAPYMELMDEIFGNTPIIKNDHTVCVGLRPFEKVSVDISSPTQLPSSAVSPLPSTSTVELPAAPHSSLSPSPSCSNSFSFSSHYNSSSDSVGRKKRTAREIYYEKKN
ncbi:uncharacterized protein [Eurosta solidaginis]|uniref:uncharacterized protein n=1 Tax=Eurosta solidaginis TaxID=178769 RepID=UPI0035314630